MCVLNKAAQHRRVRSSRVIGVDVGGRGVLAAPHEPLSPPPPGALRATDASSVEGAPWLGRERGNRAEGIGTTDRRGCRKTNLAALALSQGARQVSHGAVH